MVFKVHRDFRVIRAFKVYKVYEVFKVSKVSKVSKDNKVSKVVVLYGRESGLLSQYTNRMMQYFGREHHIFPLFSLTLINNLISILVIGIY